LVELQAIRHVLNFKLYLVCSSDLEEWKIEFLQLKSKLEMKETPSQFFFKTHHYAFQCMHSIEQFQTQRRQQMIYGISMSEWECMIIVDTQIKRQCRNEQQQSTSRMVWGLFDQAWA
jgi:hypothetical protein